MENLQRLKYGTLKIKEWELNRHRRGTYYQDRSRAQHSRNACSLAARQQSVHVGETNDCGDRGSKCAVCECAAGGSGSRITLCFWLADKGKVMQARRGKVRKEADARQQKERERINGLS